jgi:saccharopine dehydrogenase (NAD+, L-lysine-forming)
MTDQLALWLRHEANPTERRAPITPQDAGRLVRDGAALSVEQSPQRIFPIAKYAAEGCRVVPAGTWPDAPVDTVVVGLKEPGPEPFRLSHRHVFFGHAYKHQQGAVQLLDRFARGGGILLDLEYLTDNTGRRLAAFGYWAGYVGAALGVLHARGRLEPPLRSLSRPELNGRLRASAEGIRVRALLVGALGRCGRGARDALAIAGVQSTGWDMAETRRLDKNALLAHDLLVNCVLTTTPQPALVTSVDLAHPGRRLWVVCDVTCDVSSDCNLLPIYGATTNWERPVRRVCAGPPPLDVIAIDNLPSMLPVEASLAFSADLLPALRTLGSWSAPWRRCVQEFQAANGSAASGSEILHV